MTTKVVLIVDDDPMARQILNALLRGHGYGTFMAGDAMGALSLSLKHVPDLILLDLGLPAGGGLLFLTRMQAFPQLAVIPVIIISSEERAKNEPLTRQAGALAYLQKPAKNEDVLAAVRQFLGDAPA